MKTASRAGVLLAGLHAFAAHAAAPAQSTVPSTAGSLLQAGFGLLAVLALVFACAWIARRLGLPLATGGDRILKVVASAGVGQRERVVVVEVGGEWLVLGVAAGAVRHLHTQPAGSAAADATRASTDAVPALDASAFAHKLRASLAQLKGHA